MSAARPAVVASAALIALVACSTPTAPSGPAAPPADPAPAAPAAPPGLDVPALARELCGTTPGCALEGSWPAGTGAGGETLTVVALQIPNAPPTGDEYVPECRPHRQQYYRVSQAPGGAVEKLLLLDLCNDGYGAAGLGEDSVTVGPNRLVHHQMGGSADRWAFTRTYRLAPLRLDVDESCAYSAVVGNVQTVRSDWTLPRTLSRWDAPACGADGQPAPTEEMLGCDAPSLRFQYTAVPQLPPMDPPPDWRTTALGTCALAVDATGAGGYVTHGAPGAAGDASMKILMSDPWKLVVEVTDDQLVTGAKSWVNDDHLEIWTGDDALAAGCVPARSATVQWGIRIADGQVFVGKGKPKANPEVLRVDTRVDGQPVTRLVITLPDKLDVLTVVYSDSDDGATQERLLATSRLKYGDAATLGRVIVLNPGTCEGEETLRWVPTDLKLPASGPALSLE